MTRNRSRNLAGASLGHRHTQLIATPIISNVVAEKLEGSLQHFRRKERCVFAPRLPFETWLLPRRHVSSFEETDPSAFPALEIHP